MNQTWIEVQKALKSALHQEPFDHVIHDPKAFYIMVMENGLSGLIFSILKKDQTHPELYRRLERNHYDYVSRDVKQLEGIQWIDDLLNQHQIDHLFMKGSILKHIYPETYMRAMGDIDFLIKKESLAQVHELFKKQDIKCTSRSKQHDVFEMPNGIVVEVHPILYKEFNDHYQFIENVWSHVHLEKDHLYRMNLEFELIYLLYHLAKHIEAGGIGLRSVLDIALYIKHYEKHMDQKVLYEMIENMHMETFFDVMLDFCKKAFGYTFSFEIKQGQLSDEQYERLVSYLITSGIHGIGRDYNYMQARAVSYKKKEQSKTRLLLDILFPSFETMAGMYPWLIKIKILYPISWVFRWIRIMVKRPKKSLHKIKQLHISDEVIEQQKELLESIGL